MHGQSVSIDGSENQNDCLLEDNDYAQGWNFEHLTVSLLRMRKRSF